MFQLFLYFFPIQDADASCARNQDWRSAPCFDTGPVSKERYVEAWNPYYEYKGSELMEKKKIEMFEALENKTFDEWRSTPIHWNVYSYYSSTGEVAPQGLSHGHLPEEKYMSPKVQQSIYTKPYNLRCIIEFQPVMLQDGNYACVSEESRVRLLKFNLVHDDYSLLSFYNPRNSYDVDFLPGVYILNEGMVPLKFNSISIDRPMWQGRGTTGYDKDILQPGNYASYDPWSEILQDEIKLGVYPIQINYTSDIHKIEKSLSKEIEIIDPNVADFTIIYPDEWNINRQDSSSITSFYSRIWNETTPELYGLDADKRPWVFSDIEKYWTGYTGYHSENFDLLGITIQETSLTATKFFELWNDVCNYLYVDDNKCTIIQSNKVETTINQKPVTIYSYVENMKQRGYISGDNVSDQELVSIYEQKFVILIELLDEQETWFIRGHYAISSELFESKEIIEDDIFSNIVNSFKIYDYEYKWHN